MPRVAQSSIEAIKREVDLADVVAPYAQLKRAGRSWKGLSPFSHEKTPSFYVHPDKGFYKCFSSGEGGDVFTFVMKMENLEFTEAAEFLARRFGIELEYEGGGPSQETLSLRKRLFDVHETVAEWFHQQFKTADEAAPARAYWRDERGFGDAIADEVKIGYAPADPHALARMLQRREIPAEALRQSGLFYAGRGAGGGLKTRFRGRLTIPIRDVQGRVIAFTARKLDQTPEDDPAREAKYVNSPETPIFRKGRILFGMDHARAHLSDNAPALLVEGQLDAIRCWSVGLHAAVAPQGTSVTEEQMYLLRRYNPEAVECFQDGDEAGRKAALRMLPIALAAGLEMRFLILPDDTDPDALLRRGGPEALEPLRREARSGIELAVEAALPRERKPTTRDRAAAFERIFEIVRNVGSEIAREDLLARAARLIGVDPSAALRDFERAQRRRPGAKAKDDSTEETAAPERKTLTTVENELLWLVLHFPSFGPAVSEAVEDDWIDNSASPGVLLRRLLGNFREGLDDASVDSENLVETVDDRSALADILSRDLQIDNPEPKIEECLSTLRRKSHKRRLQSLDQELSDATPSSDEETRLLRERQRLRRELAQPVPLSPP